VLYLCFVLLYAGLPPWFYPNEGVAPLLLGTTTVTPL
jgi:hypothetical protein